MSLGSIKELPHEEVEAQTQIYFKALQAGRRNREDLESLRKVMQLCLAREGYSLTLLPYAPLLELILSDENCPYRLRASAAFLLHDIVAHAPLPTFNRDFRQETKAKILFLAPCLLSQTQSFLANFDNFHSWLTTSLYLFKDFCFAAVFLALRAHPNLQQPKHVRLLEAMTANWLLNASTTAAKEVSAVSFLKLATAKAKTQPVLELSGAPTRDFYTLLNVTSLFTEDQVYNAQVFSLLFSWIQYNYLSERKGPNNEPCLEIFTMQEDFKTGVAKYCLRVLDQGQLEINEKQFTNEGETFSAGIGGLVCIEHLAIIEAIRIIDALCLVDRQIVPLVFGTMKKLSANVTRIMNMNVKTTYIKNIGFIALELLQFFIDHGETASYDVEPLFCTFLESYIAHNYDCAHVALETFLFCERNKRLILSQTNMFARYFPPFLRLFCWHPELIREMESLLPALICPTNFIEMFGSILDLPLVAAALIKIRQDNGASFQTYRVLYNYLLRHDSVTTTSIWGTGHDGARERDRERDEKREAFPDSTRSLLNTFCQEVSLCAHLEEVCELVPRVLACFFDVLITYSDERTVAQLLPTLVERYDQLFPYEDYQHNIRKVMVAKLLAIFERYPHFVVSQKPLIFTLLRDHEESKSDLTLHLVWLVGEYAVLKDDFPCTPEVLTDYDEALELIAFELMSMMSMMAETPKTEETKKVLIYNNQLMSALISSLTKLAARWTPLTTRVSLCLLKIERYKSYFNPSVTERALEYLNLLKFPSIAAGLLNTNIQSCITSHYYDDQTSLPFLLRFSEVGVDESRANHLHQFSL